MRGRSLRSMPSGAFGGLRRATNAWTPCPALVPLRRCRCRLGVRTACSIDRCLLGSPPPEAVTSLFDPCWESTFEDRTRLLFRPRVARLPSCGLSQRQWLFLSCIGEPCSWPTMCQQKSVLKSCARYGGKTLGLRDWFDQLPIAWGCGSAFMTHGCRDAQTWC